MTATVIFGGSLVAGIAGTWLGQLLTWSREPVRQPAVAPTPTSTISPLEVAVLIAAYNEEVSLGQTLAALLKVTNASNIFVGSDASTDRTVEIARSYGVNVLDLRPNRGKAKVLVALLAHFRLLERFKAVLILDADILVDEHFFERALPEFNDPRTAAVAGRAISKWFPHPLPQWHMLVTAYRIRVWRMLQIGLRFGQAWKYMNVSPIIPGGASIYRSSVLRQLEIDTPGLVIEDFNMTFQVHRWRLGRIAWRFDVFIVDQEPYSIKDFIKQIKRWYVGFWQTALRFGFWPSKFWLATATFTLEMYLYGIFTILVPAFLAALFLNSFEPIPLLRFAFFAWPEVVHLSLADLLIGVFLVDFILTIGVALYERKPVLIIYGLAFYPLRYLDSLIFVIALPIALFTRSDGRWVSPRRRASLGEELALNPP